MNRRLLLLLPVIALAACGGDDDDTSAAPPETTTTTVHDMDESPIVTASVDWTARTVDVQNADAFTIEFCEGDAPMLCVNDVDVPLGIIERASFPDGVEDGDLDAWAQDFYDSIADDRVVGCDPDYVLEGDDPEPATFAGAEGVRYGFTGTVDGKVVERVIGVAAVRDDGSLDLLAANGLADDGCLSRESELPVQVMDELEPVLLALAEGSADS